MIKTEIDITGEIKYLEERIEAVKYKRIRLQESMASCEADIGKCRAKIRRLRNEEPRGLSREEAGYEIQYGDDTAVCFCCADFVRDKKSYRGRCRLLKDKESYTRSDARCGLWKEKEQG
jgi:hypothetical protein